MKPRSLLAVVAHPDDESFGLGALLHGAARAGWRTGVLCATRGTASTLCATRGTASTLHGVEGDLHTIRERELRRAATQLGVSWVHLLDHPDGALVDHAEALDKDVAAAVDTFAPDVLLTFDPNGITGHPDHIAATRSAITLGRREEIPVLGWGLPARVTRLMSEDGFTGFQAQSQEGVLTVAVDRAAQLRAIQEHRSQAVPGSPLWRRLELQGGVEHLRWLHATDVGALPWRFVGGSAAGEEEARAARRP